MTAAAWLWMALAALAAVADWTAVARRRRGVRWITKPAVILLLVAAALALRPRSGPERELFVAALVLCLAGDLLLLVEGERWFLAGLAAFLAAHLAYAAGFVAGGVSAGLLAGSAAAVLVAALLVGSRMLRAILRSGHPGRAIPVALYVVAISSMAALAAASGRPAAVAGAALFYLSDGLIGWNRFVRPLGWAAVPITATYQVGQLLLVASLARA